MKNKFTKIMKQAITLILLVLMSFSIVSAQDKIEGQPIDYDNPKDYFDKEYEAQLGDLINSKLKRHKDIAWFVISDRENNKGYEKPDMKSKVTGTVGFGEYLYVVDSNADWLKVVQAKRESGTMKIRAIQKDIGWIPKKNLLMWKNSLIDPKSLIHRKVFLLNKVSDMANVLQSQNKELVKVYTSPIGAKTLESKTIYEFYFVYKRENGRILVGKDSKLSTRSLKKNLVGWIKESKASKWNTRIALEPNFSDEAFQERKNDESKRIIGFSDFGGANLHATSGKISKDKILWDNDPITRKATELAGDGKRLRGDVVRFPMIENGNKYFRTGAIAEVTTQSIEGLVKSEIDEVKWASITADVSKLEKKQDFINVMFMIEGTKSMYDYKQAMLNAMDNIEIDLPDHIIIKYGVSVYRDTPERDVNKLFEILPLTPDRKKVVNYIDQIEFNNWNDHDDYTAQRYGLLETLKKGKFTPDETNVLVALGNYADFKYNMGRATLAEADGEEALVERDDILNFMDILNIHMISIQCEAQKNKKSADYNRFMRAIMLESAQRQHSKYVNLTEWYPDARFSNPSMGSLKESDDILIEDGPAYGRLIKAPLGSKIKGSDVDAQIRKSIADIYKDVESFINNITNLTDNGAAMDQSTGAWSPAIAREIYRMLNKAKEENGYNVDDLKKIVDEKYHLYNQIYVAKKVGGSKNGALSYVLFMPYEDLVRYIESLKSLQNAYDESADQQRDALMSTFIELIKQFTGNDNISKKDVAKFTSAELAARMQGIKKEGLEFGNRMDFEIGDIRSEKKMSDEKLRKLIDNIIDKISELEKIKDLGKQYEFSYKTKENTYFWVPVDYTF